MTDVGTPSADDLVAVVDLCVDTLAPHAGADWFARARGVDWSCRATLEHVASLVLAQRLATRATTREPLAVAIRPDAPIEELLATARATGLVLAEVTRAAPPTARAFHPAGIADPIGFIAMGMDEFLVHTADIAAALGIAFAPSARTATQVLDRIFPWWPRDAEPWDALLWANGRQDLPGHPSPGANWVWYCAPLDEWDGTVPRWDPVAQRRVGGGRERPAPL